MRIEDFWTQSYLAALTRVGPADAKAEADESVRIATAHWQEHLYSWGPSVTPRWQDQNIYRVPKTYPAGNSSITEGREDA